MPRDVAIQQGRRRRRQERAARGPSRCADELQQCTAAKCEPVFDVADGCSWGMQRTGVHIATVENSMLRTSVGPMAPHLFQSVMDAVFEGRGQTSRKIRPQMTEHLAALRSLPNCGYRSP